MTARVRSYVPALLAALAAFAVSWIAGSHHDVVANNYVLLADAWLHGHSWIAFTNDGVDAVPVHGRAYVVEGPAPALLLLPLVAAFGTRANQALAAYVFGAVAVFALWRLAQRRGLSRTQTIAVCAFAFFGTSLYTCAAKGDVWFLAHVCAFAFTSLAIAECMGAGRGPVVAIYALLAAFSRFPLVVALPLYAIALWTRERRARDVAAFVAALVPGFVLGAWYDLVRWGTIGDPGYAIWYRMMDDRSHFGYPMFSIAYAPTQAATFFATMPAFVAHAPFLIVPAVGFSVLWTSLPLAYAVLCGSGFWSSLLAIGAVAAAIPAFTYYDTGGLQFGMRHALDFEPFLLVLLMFAFSRHPSRGMIAALATFAAFGAIEGSLWLAAT